MDAISADSQAFILDNAIESRQCTVRSPMAASGPSRCGRPSRLRLMPAAAGSGIEFLRRDLPGTAPLRARLEAAVPRDGDLLLANGPMRITGAQPLLAAAVGLGIDNLRVELDGETLPLLDGSAAPFVFLLQSAGIRRQDASRRWLRVCRTVGLSGAAGQGCARLEPCQGLRLTRGAAPAHGVSPAGRLSIAGRGSEFLRELARARRHDAGDGWRFSDETARRELLDAAALLALLDGALLAELTLEDAAPALLLRLLQALQGDADAVEVVFEESGASAAPDTTGQAA